MKIINFVFFITFSNVVSAAEVEPTDAIPEGFKSVVAVIPIYSQKVSFNLPTNWKAVFEDQQSGSYMIEFIPQGEVIDNWKNLFTVQGFENLADKTTPEGFLNAMAVRFQETCGEYSVFEKLGSMNITDHQAFAAIIGCSNIPDAEGNINKEGQSELGYYISIKGQYDYFLIHKSIKGDAFDTDELPINRSNAAAFISEFMPIDICRAGGEEYECNK